jgi:hypothetical protein
MLLREIIPALDEALRQYRRTGVPNAAPPGAGVAEAFRRFGADEWNALRRTYDGAGQ